MKNIIPKQSTKVIRLKDGYVIHYDKNNKPTLLFQNEQFKSLLSNSTSLLIELMVDKIEELELILFKLNEDVANEYKCIDYVEDSNG